MKAIGVDIGGMTIKVGLVDENGKIIGENRVKTAKTADVCIDNLFLQIRTLLNQNNLTEKDIRGIGIGCPGLVDVERGVVEHLPNLGWVNVPLVALLKEKFRTEIRISNDANVATLGEVLFGAAKGYDSAVMFTPVPSVITIYKGKINYANSIVIGCSESGMAEDVLEVLKKANEQGAITIAVTNDENSPVAKEAKFHLFCNAGEEKSVVATKSFQAQTFLLLWLATELSGKRSMLKRLEALTREFAPVFTQVDALTSEYAEKFKDMTNGFVLSRGLNYAVALEAALLLQETCYMHTRGYAGSDFYHGPLASVSKDTPVIIFCARHYGDEEMQSILRADQVKCIERMLLLKAPVLLVTNDCVLTGKFSRCNDALISFSEREEISVFAFALFAEMFACKVACLIGNDPDAPRSMERITVTK